MLVIEVENHVPLGVQIGLKAITVCSRRFNISIMYGLKGPNFSVATACASANKDLPNFYDGLVAPHGEHHFYIPPLVTAEEPIGKRHEEMRKVVTGPPIGQNATQDDAMKAVIGQGTLTQSLVVAT